MILGELKDYHILLLETTTAVANNKNDTILIATHNIRSIAKYKKVAELTKIKWNVLELTEVNLEVEKSI